MSINFPNSPSNGQQITSSGKTYTYNSSKTSWLANAIPPFDSAGIANIKTQNTLDSAGINTVLSSSPNNFDSSQVISLVSTNSNKVFTVADMAALGALSGMSTGDQAIVTGTSKLYVYNGTGWFLIATITQGSPSAISNVDSSYTLATDGTPIIINAIATDPEGETLTWSSSTSGLTNEATITQGTGDSSNYFTVTPSTNDAHGGTFTLTLGVTDGQNGAVNFPIGFTLQFVVTAFDYLIVAGGGGASSLEAGGGGAGGMIAVSNQSTSVGTTYNIVIGTGGAGNGSRSQASSGTNSSISGFTAALGGGGGGANSVASQSYGANGGSGGGGGGASSGGGGAAGTGTSGQGNNGGTGQGDAGGGGGGAGAAGQNAPANAQSGNGGVGLSNSITGSAVFYAGGGGGANRLARGLGGNGGGGDGGASANGTAGTPNTGGGGGGGGGSGYGGAGGSGIVIIRTKGGAATSVTGASSTTTVGSDTVYVWNGSQTQSGSITI